MTNVDWAAEFARVISCTACTSIHCPKLLRDASENVPQPGYIGPNFCNRRVLLVGQNPGTPKRLDAEDMPYTSALRTLRDCPTDETFESLCVLLDSFIPRWPVHNNYFPLEESGLGLKDIAYLNVVRCRTFRDTKPNVVQISNCLNLHFGRWLDYLMPKVVVFIGKWAADQAANVVSSRGIPYAFMNRQRSLSSESRLVNRQSVIKLVQSTSPHLG